MVRRGRDTFSLYWFSIFIILAIISTSIGYGLWSGRLMVQGKIYTGNLDMDFTKVCPQAICCGCSSNMNYVWDQNDIDVDLTYSSHHCKLLIVARITNNGSIPGITKKLFVDGIDNNTHVYLLFINNPLNISYDMSSYPMELHNGWNIIVPHKIQLEPGDSTYLAVLIIFSGGCICHCGDDVHQDIQLNIHFPWRVPGLCIGSWTSDLDISVDANHT